MSFILSENTDSSSSESETEDDDDFVATIARLRKRVRELEELIGLDSEDDVPSIVRGQHCRHKPECEEECCEEYRCGNECQCNHEPDSGQW